MASGMSSSTGGHGRAEGIIVGTKAGSWDWRLGCGEPSGEAGKKKPALFSGIFICAHVGSITSL